MEISLALGGGGSRGYSHVGVLRRLCQEGFQIAALAGTSAGGIIAALFAAGFTPDEMEARFAKIDQTKLFGRSAHDGPALLGLAGAEKVLYDLLGDRTFSDLNLPCALVAVDINASQEVVLTKGRVVDAVLATIAVPGVFPPKVYSQHQLVDGGVLDPVPVSVARSLAPHLPVVAVVLTPMIDTSNRAINLPLPLPVPVPAPLFERLTKTRIAQAFNIFLSAVDAGGRMITELRLQVDQPEVIIQPEVNDIGLLDTVDIHKVIRLGEKATDAALSQLERALKWPNRLKRRVFPRQVK
jgi:NTE family protein